MKTIVYNGNSKIIKRIVALLNGKAPLPTSDTWGTNGQVLTTDGTGATSWADASGGSDVSFSQTLTSGTEVGEITIDETTTKMYAPTPPTKVSDLSNDSGFITSTVNNLTNYYLSSQVDSLLSAKQGTLTAGDGIDITSNTISLEYFSVVNGCVNITYTE